MRRYECRSIAPRALISNRQSVTTNWEPRRRNWLLTIGIFPSDHHTSNLLILMTMKDRIDRGSPESSRFSITEKSEFQASSAKQATRLEGSGKCKTATGDTHPSGGTIRPGTMQLGFRPFHNIKNIVSMICNNAERVAWTYRIEIKFLRNFLGMALHEAFPVADHLMKTWLTISH
jgi:hypothetical protein